MQLPAMLSQAFIDACSLADTSSTFDRQDPELYAKLPEAEDDENDMLDLAYGLTETCVLLRCRGFLALKVYVIACQA